MVHLVRQFFREFDMFSSGATLRTRGQPEKSNTCGGILSILIILIFIYVFISQFASVTSWQQIQSVETKKNAFDQGRKVTDFMVGVGLEGFRIQGIAQYLRFQILQVTKNSSATLSTRRLKTEKCRRDHWSQLGDHLEQNFVSYSLDKKICVSRDESFAIEQPSSEIYRVLVVEVNACRRMHYSNKTYMYDYCANENLTRYKNQLWIDLNKYFVANVVYLNTAFNPLSKMPTSKYMESVRLTFTISQGSEAFVSLSTYEIQTDTSIFPIEQVQSSSGHSVQQVSTNNFEIVWYFEHASCTFSLSSTSLLFSRKIGKIDEILSYVGGLFGTIISILSFFLMSFNQYRYELMAASSAFSYNEERRKIKQEDFTFLVYLKYQVYDWVKTLTCHEIGWQDCQQIDETRQEAISQLDITLMFKKIQYFEGFIEYAISDKEKVGLFITEPPSIEKVRTKRLIMEYYDKIIQGKSAVTIDNLNVATGIFEFAQALKGISKDEPNSRIGSSSDQFYEREDILEYSIQKYQEMRTTDEEKEEICFSPREQEVQKFIALSFFTLPEESRRKIQRKIPLKILRRLLNIKNNESSANVMSIDLCI